MSEVFTENANILRDFAIVKMMADYGYLGFGWYIAVTAELYQTNGKCNFGDLEIIARNTGIKQDKLKKFIDNCVNKYTCNGQGIFQADENCFWSNKVIASLNGKKVKKTAGEQGGRPASSKVFEIPSVSDIEEYCLERNNGINAQSFFNFYESKGWMIGKNKMKDWKAAVRTWEIKNKKDETASVWGNI